MFKIYSKDMEGRLIHLRGTAMSVKTVALSASGTPYITSKPTSFELYKALASGWWS
jgi:hypothetical protein